MKQAIKSSAIAGGFFTVWMSIYYALMYGKWVGLIGGVASGVLFTLFVTLALYHQNKQLKEIKCNLLAQRVIVHEGTASRRAGIGGCGGWLFLTNDDVIFKANDFNFQKRECYISLEDISRITKKNNLGIVPDGIVMILNDGTPMRFAVQNREVWIREIEQALKGRH